MNGQPRPPPLPPLPPALHSRHSPICLQALKPPQASIMDKGPEVPGIFDASSQLTQMTQDYVPQVPLPSPPPQSPPLEASCEDEYDSGYESDDLLGPIGIEYLKAYRARYNNDSAYA